MSKLEEEILLKFVKTRKLGAGLFITEVPIGSTFIKDIPKGNTGTLSQKSIDNLYEGTLSKKIDAIFVEGNNLLNEFSSLGINFRSEPLRNIKLGSMRNILKKLKGKNIWILEVKKRLDASAMGQILIYSYHFSKDHPEIKIKGRGIICKQSDLLIEPVCKELDIEVFKV